MKQLSKKQQQLAQNYFNVLKRYGKRTLSNVYKTFSSAKYLAERYILEEMKKYNKKTCCWVATDYTIIGYNSMMFSCAYAIRSIYTDIIEAIIYYTPYNKYIIQYNDMLDLGL